MFNFKDFDKLREAVKLIADFFTDEEQEREWWEKHHPLFQMTPWEYILVRPDKCLDFIKLIIKENAVQRN